MKHFLTTLSFSFFLLFVNAQKLDVYLNHLVLNQKQDQSIQVLVKAFEAFIEKNTQEFGYSIDQKMGDYYAITIALNRLKDFSARPEVQRISRSIGPAFMLNDSVRAHNNVNAVHQGIAPLETSYQGKDVIIGIIDLGLEVNHPDFLNADSSTRVLYYWNQNSNAGSNPTDYNYGTEWNAAQIDSGLLVHTNTSDHGSHVTGIAAGNGRALGKFQGMAPKADIIFVDYYQGNVLDWKTTVNQAVEYIFNKADALGKPCVVNLSLGSYIGSHDGRDPYTQFTDSLVQAKQGRALVCASGNSGDADAYHLSYEVTADTNFTWFKYNPSTWYGFSGLIFELWADTVDFQNVQFSLGADRILPSQEFIGQTPFKNIQIGSSFDTIYNSDMTMLAEVGNWVELIDDKYFMQVYILQVDSTDFNYRFSTTGSGKFDVWSSSSFTGSSDMVVDSTAMPFYKNPDKFSSIVSGWACSEQSITVGNYTSVDRYLDFKDSLQVFDDQPGALFHNSSIGPTRDGRIKPDLTAPGGIVLSCARLVNLAIDTNVNPSFIAQGGFHKRNSGTSMAAPSVSGAVALFYEYCPWASLDSIKQALRMSAKSDDFTTDSPNPRFGFGKLDAFELLKHNTPTLQALDDSLYCQGCSNQTFWVLNDTIIDSLVSSIEIQDSGLYYVQTYDDQGCLKTSEVGFFQPSISTHLQPDKLNLNVFPNPCSGQLYLGSDLQIETVSVYDVHSRLLKAIKLQKHQSSIDLAELSNGTYFIDVRDENLNRATKMIQILK